MWVILVVILLYGHVMALFNMQAAQYQGSLDYIKSLERPNLGQKGKNVPYNPEKSSHEVTPILTDFGGCKMMDSRGPL